MQIKLTRLIAASSMLALTAGSASAAIIYVDASASNTTVNGNTMVIQNANGAGAYNITDDDFTGGSNSLWKQRDPVGNGGNTFQGDNGSPTIVTTTDVLNTSVSGLANGIYKVYAYFWDAEANANPSLDASNWDLAAQLNGGGYIDKARSSAGVITASTQTFTVAPLFTEGNRTLYAIDLGTFTGTSFTVDAKAGAAGVAGGSVTDVRTWYDGVGYELVPEPSSLALLGLGGLLVARRRRA